MSDKTNKPNHHTDATMSQTETQSGPLDVFPIGLGCTGMTPHSYPDSPRREEMIQVLRTANSRLQPSKANTHCGREE